MSSTTAPAVIELTDTGLNTHPAVREMTRDLFAATPEMLATLTHPDGSPTSRFMSLANLRFWVLTGESAGPFLGSVARAVLARLEEMRAVWAQDAVTEAEAADLEARQAIRDMWRHGSPRCLLTKYADKAGNLADRLAAE
ncbi:hypothetical protein [Streptomyces bottropensis]|uniref:hypothetical protein n=1 Tax=Streptomyces bottropensis TaxID=42235 RepID=UPI0036C8995D